MTKPDELFREIRTVQISQFGVGILIQERKEQPTPLWEGSRRVVGDDARGNDFQSNHTTGFLQSELLRSSISVKTHHGGGFQLRRVATTSVADIRLAKLGENIGRVLIQCGVTTAQGGPWPSQEAFSSPAFFLLVFSSSQN
ncbi:hypothetical protein TNCV_280051 [Trichonephila clavipes]|nr:hypothetical protein TNCV_280051 [Trichonephila clavipes]